MKLLGSSSGRVHSIEPTHSDSFKIVRPRFGGVESTVSRAEAGSPAGAAGLISAHWPERLYRSFIINMPGFFSILWRLVEPMMAASTRKKIRLLRSKQVRQPLYRQKELGRVMKCLSLGNQESRVVQSSCKR